MIDVSIFRKNAVLNRLGEENLTALMDRAQVITFKSNQLVFDRGDEIDFIYFPVPSVNSRQQDYPVIQYEYVPRANFKPVKLDRIGPDGFFGELECLLAGLAKPAGRRVTKARSLGDTLAVKIPVASMLAVMAGGGSFRQTLLRESTTRLAKALDVQALAKGTANELRLAAHMSELSTDFGQFHANRVSFKKKISQQSLADELGLSLRLVTGILSQWSESGLINTTPFQIADFERLCMLADIADTEPDKYVRTICNRVDELIGDVQYQRALSILSDVARYYRHQPEFIFRLALVLARCGDSVGVEKILSKGGLESSDVERLHYAVLDLRAEQLQLMGASEPAQTDGIEEEKKARLLALDIASLRVRMLKNRVQTENSPAEKRKLALEAAAKYEALFRQTSDIYPGANAATMYAYGGNAAKAKLISEACRAPNRASNANYWDMASAAELFLAAGEFEKARKHLELAFSCADTKPAKIAVTRKQLRTYYADLPNLELLLQELPSSTSIVYSGHMLRAQDVTAEKSLAIETHIRECSKNMLTSMRISGAFGSLACGSDIIIAEVLLELGISLNVILPFNVNEFAKTSVVIGDAEGFSHWNDRFRRCLAAAASLVVIRPGEIQKMDHDGLFNQCFCYSAGKAIANAELQDASPVMIAVAKTNPADGIAGTSSAVAAWQRTGFELKLINYPSERKPALARQGEKGCYLVFVSSVDAGRMKGFLAGIMKSAKGKLEPQPSITIMENSRSSGVVVISDSLRQTEEVYHALADYKTRVQIFLDFGVVKGGDDKPVKEKVSRQEGAGGLTGAEFFTRVASANFVMEYTFSRAQLPSYKDAAIEPKLVFYPISEGLYSVA